MFAMTAWGLDTYQDCRTKARHTIEVGPHDMYSDGSGTSGLSGYALEFWPLPRYALPSARLVNGLIKLAGPPHPYYGNNAFDYTVLDVGNPLMILGLVVTRFSPFWHAPAGMTLSGPSDLAQQRALFAVSPLPYADEVASADYDDVPNGHLDATRTVIPPFMRNWDRRS